MEPEIQTVPLLDLASGDRLTLQVYRFVGQSPGRKVYIQANLHGAELAGNAVIHHLIQGLQTLEAGALQGEIWLVPLCNPLAVNQRSHHFSSGRYNPYDGRDWNRIFWDYETQVPPEVIQQFAQAHQSAAIADIQTAYRHRIQTQFQQDRKAAEQQGGAPIHHRYRNRLQCLALDADTLIDLHSSTNQGLVYVYYSGDRHSGAAQFGLDLALQLDQYDGDAFDEAFIKPWLALEAAFETLGRSLRFAVDAYTLELGSGMALDPEAIAQGVQGIHAYLQHSRVLSDGWLTPATRPTRFYTSSDIQRYYAPTGGLVRSRLQRGDRVTQGQPLYQLLCLAKHTPALPHCVDVHALQDGLVFDVGINHAVNEGEYVLALLPSQPTGPQP
jgi:predicted deacylase